MGFLEACKEAIRIDSSGSAGSEAITAFFENVCEEFGLRTELQESLVRGQKHSNLIAIREVENAPFELMFQAHLDTYEPGTFGMWENNNHNPFEPMIVDNCLFGLGAASPKVDLLAKLYAYKELSEKTFKKGLVFLGTYSAKDGMMGAVQFVRRSQLRANLTLVSEPTGLSLVSKGCGAVKVEIMIPFSEEEISRKAQIEEGESVSTQSRIFTSRNTEQNVLDDVFAYLKALPKGVLLLGLDATGGIGGIPTEAYVEFDVADPIANSLTDKLQKVLELVADLRVDFKEQVDASMEESTLTLNKVNMIESGLLIKGFCHLATNVSQPVAESWMAKLQKSCEEIRAQFRMTEFKRPFRTDPESKKVQDVQNIAKEFGFSTDEVLSLTSEANVFHRFQMHPLVFGPARKSKNSEEFVSIDDLLKAKEFYKSLIERMCIV